jgi:oligoribonuclease
MLAIFLDIETTGLDPARHRPIDIAFKIVDLSTNCTVHSFQSVIKLPMEAWAQKDPTSIEINGFTWEQIEKGRDLQDVRQEIIQLFDQLHIQRGKAVYICQNPAFDRSFFIQLVDIYTQEKLNWPYHWLDFASMYWASIVQKALKEGTSIPLELNLSKNAIAEAYHLPPEILPHRAMNGVNHLIECYQAVLGVKLNPPEKLKESL